MEHQDLDVVEHLLSPKQTNIPQLIETIDKVIIEMKKHNDNLLEVIKQHRTLISK